MAKMTLQEAFKAANGFGNDVLNQLFAAKGMSGIGDGYSYISPEAGMATGEWGMPDVVGYSPYRSGASWSALQGTDENGNPTYSGAPTADAFKAYDGYQFDWTPGEKYSGVLTAYDPTGKQAGKYTVAPKQSLASGLLEWGGLAGAGFGLAGLAGLGPLAAAGGAASGASNAASNAGTASSIGAGEGASQLAAWQAANPLTAAQVTASTLPAAGLPGLSAGLGSTIGSGALEAINAYTAANPVTASQIAATVPSGGLPGLSGGLLSPITSNALEAVNAYTAANPVTAAEVAATVPNVPAISVATPPAAFNAAADSQLASNQLGITGAQSAASATAPAAVDLGSLGGVTSTAAPLPLSSIRVEELAGYQTNGALPSSPAVAGGGGLLGSLGGTVGDVASWMKANPVLGRLLMSGATTLLSGAGGGSSGGSSGTKTPVTPVTWNSPIQQGLLGQAKQYAPPAITQNRPAGLLAQGYQNDGAWRYLGG